MTHRIAAFALLILGCMLCACDTPIEARGRVMDFNGKPVPNGQVYIFQNDRNADLLRHTVTNADGTYNLNVWDHLLIGQSRRLEVWHPDYKPAVARIKPRCGRDVIEHVDFELAPLESKQVSKCTLNGKEWH